MAVGGVLMSEIVEARRVRRGVWMWHGTEPRGWFLVTHTMGVPARADGKTVRIAVNGRGPGYESFHAPGEPVTVRSDGPP